MSSLRRDVVAGAVAGLIAGFVFGGTVQAQGMIGGTAGLLGLAAPGLGLPLLLAIAVLAGAGFGAIFRYQPHAYAATLSSGLLFGLLGWIVGPLTLMPLLLGQRLTWSLAEASAVFPSLIGYLLYGGLTGIGFYALVTLYLRTHPEPEAVAAPTAPATRRVVVLGGGFAGVSAAQHLEQRLAGDPSVEITLVSQSNYLLFTPMLAEVASSSLEARHISAPVRAACQYAQFRRAEVEAIDTERHVVHVRVSASLPTEALPYDHLVLALGAVPNYYALPGMEAHSFTLKSLQDAIQLRNHVLELLERADVEPDPAERRRQLTFVVVGGGFAGTEMIAELFDLVHSTRRYYPGIPREEPRFVLIHSRERILPEISPGLADYALRKLQARGIEFLLNARVTGATADAVLVGDGDQVPTRTLVWTAGNQPNPLLATLPCERNRAGAVVAESTLQVKGFTNLWAVGDCAQIPDPADEGAFYPPTAQHALREGKGVAANVAAALRGMPLEPFRFRTIGILVALGHRTAVAEVRGWKFSGQLAWFMWRTIYLGKLPGLEKKARVALDWTMDLFFPRDIALTASATAAVAPQALGADQPNGMSQAQPTPGPSPEFIKERVE